MYPTNIVEVCPFNHPVWKQYAKIKTSEDRKDKANDNFIDLYKLAIEARSTLSEHFGYDVVLSSQLSSLKAGDKIRCCAYECGCIGQEEVINDFKLFDSMEENYDGYYLYHSNHDIPFAKVITDKDNPSVILKQYFLEGADDLVLRLES